MDDWSVNNKCLIVYMDSCSNTIIYVVIVTSQSLYKSIELPFTILPHSLNPLPNSINPFIAYEQTT